MGLRVLVVDDEPPSRARLVRALAELPTVASTEEAADGPAAVAALERSEFDLVLLDIRMPGCDGFDVVRQVRGKRLPPIVFVTAHDEYALRAFDVEALDYLAKPWTRERLARVVDRVHQQRARVPRRIALRTGARIASIDPEDITYAVAARNYVTVHLRDGEVLARETLVSLAARLPSSMFLRVHRSTIVRLSAVQRLETDDGGEPRVVLAGGARLRVGRSRVALVREALDPGT